MRRGPGGSPVRPTVVPIVLVLLHAAPLPAGPVSAAAQERASVGPVPGATVVWLPARYEAHRFWVTPVTPRGDTLRLYTDTGGGTNMLFPSAVERLGLPTRSISSPEGGTARVAALPPFRGAAAVPMPSVASPTGPWLLVREPPGYIAGDGFLGRTWFAGRVWALDYPGRALGLVLGWDPDAVAREHRVPLGFRTDSAGRLTTHFPRVRVEVDDDSLDLLLDTGATVPLSGDAREELGGGAAERGTSFIVRSVYEEWRRRHPDWRVIEGADRTGDVPMIRVPEVSVGGHTVGPVWFTVRPDVNFRRRMSRWMDRRIDGALGGSALRHFRVVLDYPRATAAFLRPDAGGAGARGDAAPGPEGGPRDGADVAGRGATGPGEAKMRTPRR